MINQAISKLKEDLGAFADSLASAADLQVKSYEQMIAEFNQDILKVKQWCKNEDQHEHVTHWLVDNIRTKQNHIRPLEGPLANYSENLPAINESLLLSGLESAKTFHRSNFYKAKKDLDNVHRNIAPEIEQPQASLVRLAEEFLLKYVDFENLFRKNTPC